jgi:hypothetical protein
MNSRIFTLTVWAAVAIATIPGYSQIKREATIEIGTKTQLVLQSRLSSKLSEVGDPVIATLNEPIYVNGLLLIPRDAEFHGRVTSVKPAGRSHKSAQMSIIFENVLAPWGLEPVGVVITAIDDWDHDKKLRTNSEGKVNGGHQGEKTVDNVIRGGQLGALGAGTVIAGRGTEDVRGALGGGGVAIGGGMLGGLLLTKGGEIQLGPGVILRIEFVKSLALPVTQDPSRIPQ